MTLTVRGAEIVTGPVTRRWGASGRPARFPENPASECSPQGYEAEPIGEDLPLDVRKSLDSMLFFGGHNGFVGGGEKEDAIRRLREIAHRSHRPSADLIEAYLLASGETHAKAAARARRWYEEISAGKQHRDYARRTI